MHDVMELSRGFVDYKRALGYVYPEQTVELVESMARFLTARADEAVITKETADEYVARRGKEAASTQNKRASAIRQFALYLQAIGIDCYVPDMERGRRECSNFSPRIITEEEMGQVIRVADEWPDKCRSKGFRESYSTLVRMLWCCGLRLGEALSLKVADVDLELAAITVRRAKHKRTRILPLSPSLAAHLEGCASITDAEGPDAYLMPGPAGGRKDRGAASLQIGKFMAAAGVTRPDGRPVRTHDVRHSYAVCALGKMQEAGIDVRCALPLLSAYMGHADVKSTELYLRLTADAHPIIHAAMADAYSSMFPEVPNAR